MVRWRRFTEVTSIAVGAAAAVFGVALAAEKVAVGRKRLRPDPAAAEPLGQLRGPSLIVLADDGVPLHTEIDGPRKAPITSSSATGSPSARTAGTSSAGTSARRAIATGSCSWTSAATAGPGGRILAVRTSISSPVTCTPLSVRSRRVALLSCLPPATPWAQ